MKINLEDFLIRTLFFRMQKSDVNESMFLPSFMRQQSRVSCSNYWEYNIVWNILASVPSQSFLLSLASVYSATDGSKRFQQSQIQKDNYSKQIILYCEVLISKCTVTHQFKEGNVPQYLKLFLFKNYQS